MRVAVVRGSRPQCGQIKSATGGRIKSPRTTSEGQTAAIILEHRLGSGRLAIHPHHDKPNLCWREASAAAALSALSNRTSNFDRRAIDIVAHPPTALKLAGVPGCLVPHTRYNSTISQNPPNLTYPAHPGICSLPYACHVYCLWYLLCSSGLTFSFVDVAFVLSRKHTRSVSL